MGYTILLRWTRKLNKHYLVDSGSLTKNAFVQNPLDQSNFTFLMSLLRSTKVTITIISQFAFKATVYFQCEIGHFWTWNSNVQYILLNYTGQLSISVCSSLHVCKIWLCPNMTPISTVNFICLMLQLSRCGL